MRRCRQLSGETVKLANRISLAAVHWAEGRRPVELLDVLEANGFRRVIQTAYVERVNLTFRQCIAALGRQTWSLVSEQQLLYHDHLARPHESLREPVPGLKRTYRDRTPAMALGITDRVMTVGDILRTPLIPSAA